MVNVTFVAFVSFHIIVNMVNVTFILLLIWLM